MTEGITKFLKSGPVQSKVLESPRKRPPVILGVPLVETCPDFRDAEVKNSSHLSVADTADTPLHVPDGCLRGRNSPSEPGGAGGRWQGKRVAASGRRGLSAYFVQLKTDR